jgi:hypothetical protein
MNDVSKVFLVYVPLVIDGDSHRALPWESLPDRIEHVREHGVPFCHVPIEAVKQTPLQQAMDGQRTPWHVLGNQASAFEIKNILEMANARLATQRITK